MSSVQQQNPAGLQLLGSILAKLKLPGPGPLAQAQIMEAVTAVFGAAAARELRVVSYRKGKLAFEVRSAARAFEFQAFARGSALEELRGRPGLEQLSEITFKNGSWRVHGQQ